MDATCGTGTLKNGVLFVVATPIGNLDDLSPRARTILAEVDLIAAEDTRHSRRLLSHFGISTPLMALHEHNERDVVAGLVARISRGTSVALICDAGTPLISDPGFRVVQAAHREGLTVSPLPGPSAVTAALSVSGMATDRYCFEGFLPARRNARRARLDLLQGERRSMIFLVPVHRLAVMLEDMRDVFGGQREAFVARELTKMHEQCVAASLGELLEQVGSGRIVAKGEFVIIVAGATAGTPTDDGTADRLLRALVGLLPGRQAAAIVAEVYGLPRNDLYRRMLALTGGAADDRS